MGDNEDGINEKTYVLFWAVRFRGYGVHRLALNHLNRIDCISIKDMRFIISEVKRTSEGLIVSGNFIYPHGVTPNKQDIFSVISDLLSEDAWSPHIPPELVLLEVKKR